MRMELVPISWNWAEHVDSLVNHCRMWQMTIVWSSQESTALHLFVTAVTTVGACSKAVEWDQSGKGLAEVQRKWKSGEELDTLLWRI